MLGYSFHTMKWLIVITTGVAWGLPFFLTFYIVADVPAAMVQSVWKKMVQIQKKPLLDISALFGKDSETNLEKKEIEREKFRTFCSRLGLRTNYEELEDKGKMLMIMTLVCACIFIVVGIVADFAIFVLLGAILIPVSVIAKSMPFMDIEKKIKKLDQAVIFETPIFINNIRVMNTKATLEKVLESYLDHAGALKQDIKLTLASLKNRTNVKALIDMANRMQKGQRLEEVSSMVDLMKSLYSGTNVERCCINLELLANQINELHVKPYIDARKDKKVMTMQMAVAAIVVLVFLLYSSPMIIEMVMISGDLNS